MPLYTQQASKNPHTGYNFIKSLLNANRQINVIIAGDSTATLSGGSESANGGWTYQFFQKLAPYFPKRSFFYVPNWNAANGLFAGTMTLQTGTTAGLNCNIYNCAAGGTMPTFPLGSQHVMLGYRPPAALARGSADLIIWNYGFNMNINAPRDVNSLIAQQYASLSQLMQLHPKAGVIIMEQWPLFGNQFGENNSRACRELARMVNASLVSTEYKFLDAGKPSSWYSSNVVGDAHLSQYGYSIISSWLLEDLLNSNSQKTVLEPSLNTFLPNLISNGRFDNFSAGVITGFTASNVALSENTSDYITGTRSIDMTIGTNSASYIEYNISDVALLKRLSGKTICLSADIQLPAVGNNNNMAVLTISYDGSTSVGQASFSVVSTVPDIGGFNWTKKCVIFTLPTIVNAGIPITLRFYAQYAAGSPSGASRVLKIDNLKLDMGEKPSLL